MLAHVPNSVDRPLPPRVAGVTLGPPPAFRPVRDDPMDFPLLDLLDPDACYARLLRLLHPGGLACPRCGGRDRPAVHRRHRAPVLDYRCRACRRVFNAYTGTALGGSHKTPAQVLLILRGIAQGVPTAGPLLAFVRAATRPGVARNTDEWVGYGGVAGTGRRHAAVRHARGRGEWARDDDGDGVREVHNNTCEGLWAGVRTFLRPFRG